MKIAVCIKHVPVSNDVAVDPVTHALIRENTEGMINPADLNALEEAILLKEATGGHITVFTMGPHEAEKSLRTALSLGCDEACLLTDRAFAGGDTVATARVLAEGIRRAGDFDLILTGAISSDGATGQVGPMIAELLSLPHLSEAKALFHHPDNGSVLQAAYKHRGQEVRVELTLPALLTISFGVNTPRLPTLRSQRAAKEKPLEQVTNQELGLRPEEAGLEGSPTTVIDSYEPPKTRRAVFLEGGFDQLAAQMMELIKTEKEK